MLHNVSNTILKSSRLLYPPFFFSHSLFQQYVLSYRACGVQLSTNIRNGFVIIRFFPPLPSTFLFSPIHCFNNILFHFTPDVQLSTVRLFFHSLYRLGIYSRPYSVHLPKERAWRCLYLRWLFTRFVPTYRAFLFLAFVLVSGRGIITVFSLIILCVFDE